MPRRKKLKKQLWIPDTRFSDRLITQFISYMIKRGKKSVAEKNLYLAIDIIEKKSGQSGIEIFNKALNNVKPTLEVKSRRVGGATYQVPQEVKPARRISLAIRWLIANSVKRGEHTMAQKLAAEFTAAANNEGASIKKKDDTHKMAEANKAFAHFRW